MKRPFALACSLMLAAWAGPVNAQSAVLLADALRALAQRAGVSVVFAPQVVEGRRLPAPADQRDAPRDVARALRRLLAGTGLVARRLGERTYVVEPAPRRAAPMPVQPAPGEGAITVTALRRPTPLADTPVSLVVLSRREMERDHASGLAALAALAPSLRITTMGAGLNRLSLRGVYASGEATVGLYYGNVPMAGPGGTSSDPGMMTPDLMLVDIDRVEVLRGPQGTLFGTGSLAGTVRILFHPPDLARREGSLDAEGSLSAQGGGSGTVSAMANLPLGGRLALRAVGYQESRGGVANMPALGLAHTDRATRTGGRLALRWQPGGDWRVDAMGLYQAGRIGNASQQSWGAPRYANMGQALLPFDDSLWLASLDLHGALGGGVVLDATLARSVWRPHRFFDLTKSVLSHVGDAAGCEAWLAAACSAQQQAGYDAYVQGSAPTVLDQPLRVGMSTAELRLSGSGALTWTLGGFASHRADAGSNTTLAAASDTVMMQRHFASGLDEYALFADGGWRGDGWLGFSAGGRFFHYARHSEAAVTMPNFINGPYATSGFAMAYRASGAVGRARLELRPDKRTLAYAQVASGFRPGGINVVPGLPDALATYRDDRMTSWEIGTRLAPHAAWSVDASAFRQIWSNMQYAANSTDGAYVFITNIGGAHIHGGELTLDWHPRAAWHARLEATLTDARLSADQSNAAATTTGRKGDRLPYVAPLALRASLGWEHAIGRDLRLSATLDAHYTGRSYSAFRATPTTRRLPMGDEATMDIDVGVERGRTRLSLFARNLADTRAIAWSGTTLSADYALRERPLTVGLSLHCGFGAPQS